jgi:GntR family transcriptional repressor for pyruvate dehydrogenase complex
VTARQAAPSDSVFAPVRSQTAFEEALDRLGTAIKLGLLAPGTQLPAERELCARLEISRSTLRQALTALVQSGHLRAARGRGGGTFVADRPPPAEAPTVAQLAGWQDALDSRLAIEIGVALLAAERADAGDVAALDEQVAAMDGALDDFPAYRQADIRFHIALAKATSSPGLLVVATEAQSAMTDLIAHIAHPHEVLGWSNAQHAALLAAVRARDGDRAMRVMTEHVRGTEHVLQGLLPG